MDQIDQNLIADIKETSWTVFPMKDEPKKAIIFWPVTIITGGSWFVHKDVD